MTGGQNHDDDRLREFLATLTPDQQQQMLRDLVQRQQQQQRNAVMSLGDFKRTFWPGYEETAHQRAIDTLLVQVAQYIFSGGVEGVNRAAVFMPPRHGKTHTVSRMFPAWLLSQKPDLRMMTASYGASLAHRNSRSVRNIVLSQQYRDLFPRVRLVGKRVDMWDTSESGGMIAAGVGGAITGHGGQLIIIDDPVRGRADAESATIRQRALDWYVNDLLTRLEEPGAVILMMTRWHTDDLAGALLESDDGDDWAVLSLPALAGDNDPLGRDPGAALWPSKYGTDWLEARRAAMGSYAFEALYQQQPIAKAAGLFDVAHCAVIDVAPVCERMVRFYDLAVSSKTTSDYSVGVLLGETDDKRLVILDVARWQANPADTFERIVRQAQADGAAVPIVLEADNHARSQLDFLLRDDRLRDHSIKAVSPQGDKYTRAAPVASRLNAGHVLLKRSHWNAAFLDELAVFPAGRNDDQVDALSGAYHQLVRAVDTRRVGFMQGYASFDRHDRRRIAGGQWPPEVENGTFWRKRRG